MGYPIYLMFRLSIDWRVDWLIDQWIDGLMFDWLIDWLIDWLFTCSSIQSYFLLVLFLFQEFTALTASTGRDSWYAPTWSKETTGGIFALWGRRCNELNASQIQTFLLFALALALHSKSLHERVRPESTRKTTWKSSTCATTTPTSIR